MCGIGCNAFENLASTRLRRADADALETDTRYLSILWAGVTLVLGFPMPAVACAILRACNMRKQREFDSEPIDIVIIMDSDSSINFDTID
eukprot:scaffold267071_cov20-Prasinocladus_malaysianus.AAC.1